MKKFKVAICLVLAVCVTGVFSVASASSKTVKAMSSNSVETATGKAILNEVACDASNCTYFTSSNITDSPINVKVTIYKHDGTLLTDDGSSSSGIIRIADAASVMQNYSDNNNDSTLTYTLPAHTTGTIVITNAITFRGYGVVQWSQSNSSAVVAMVAEANVQVWAPGTAVDRYYVPVNGGNAF